MKGEEIKTALKSNFVTLRWFKGVHSADCIPVYTERSAMVINLDNRTKSGSHWIAVFIENEEEIEIFDSFGRHPIFLGENILRFLSNYKIVIYNHIWFQHPCTTVCGAYCVFYIRNKSVGRTLLEIQSTLAEMKFRDFEVHQEMLKWP